MRRLKKIWSILIFAFLTVVFFWKFFLRGLLPIPADIIVGLYYPWLDYKWGFPVGVPVKNPLPSDIPSLVYPWRIFVIEQRKKGILPLWNPHIFSGMPLLANFQSAVFSLSNIFFLFFPQEYAWSLGVIVQPFFTGFFTFLFLRHLKLDKLASFLGGIVFAFCGFSIIWLEYNVHGHTAMWLPILLLITDKLIESKKLRWFFLGSFILAIQIFAGYPQIVLYTLTTLAFYTLFLKRSLSWRVPLFVVLGFLLAAVQLLPGWEALRLSVREIDPIAKSSSGGFLPWQNLVTFLAPDFFGNPATYNFWGKPYYDNFALYIGILPLLLAVFAVFFRRDKLSWFFTFLSVFALAIALPTPIAKIIDASGIYGVKAIPARIIFLLDFSLAILAALGLDWLLKKKKAPLMIVLPFLLSLIGLWSFALRTDHHIAQRNLILPTTLFFASFILLKFFSPWQSLFIVGVFFLTVFDLFRFGWKYLPFFRPDLVFPSTLVIEFLQKQEKPFRVEFGEAIPQNMWMPYSLESAAGYDAMAPLRYSQFLGALRTGRADTPYGRVAQVENYQSRLFDLLNIKYVLAVKYDEKGIRSPAGKPRPIFNDLKFKLVFEDKTVQVYENQNVLPRAFFVDEYEVVSDDQGIIDKLLSLDFDLRKKVVLEENIALSKADRILFIAESFYPGWKAFVDGQETKIYRANFTFRAIKVPAGEDEIRFIYQPLSFRIGLAVSLVTLILLLIGGIGNEICYRYS